MKRLSSRHLPRLVAEVHVVPWVDLLLMLVLLMMVFSTAGIQGRGAAETFQEGAGQAPGLTMELRVAKDLKLTLAGKDIEHQALIGELSRQVAAAPGLGVVVVIPPSLSAPQLIQVMDALRSSKVRHTAVVVNASPAN
jgi:biopolymer transport protein ExbD